jgi:flagellar biosynthesis component FlhA
LVNTSLVDGGSMPVLVLKQEAYQRALTMVAEAVNGIQRPVLVVDSSRLRVHLRRLVEYGYPDLPVVARTELPPLEAESEGR